MTRETYKTVWVRAEMGILKEKVKKQRQIGTRKVVKTKGFINRETYEVDEPIFEEFEEWVATGKRSDTFIDIEGFSQKIMGACNTLDAEGYEVVHISDVIDGRYEYQTRELENKNPGVLSGTVWAGGWGYGYGYSVTDGVVITAKLKNA
ncbi:MAG: hypothetical protein ACK5YV_15110 [Betaproteobacteria bacterium]